MRPILYLQILSSLFAHAQEGPIKFNLLYTNDLHAHVEPHRVGWVSETRNVGGFANIATLVKREKAKNPNTLYVDAGDYFTGPYISSLTKGEAIIDVLNTIPLDAATVGNHEFDHGWENVPIQFEKANFPIINGNIFVKSTNQLVWNVPYRIVTLNGIRIGIIGLHGKFAFYDTTSDEMIKGVECRDEEEYLRYYIDTLKGRTDLILLLVHQGIPGRQSTTGSTDVARNLQKDIELAQRVPGIDILVTGHAHQGTKEPLISNGTIIVSTDALGIELGKLELTYDRKKDKIVYFKNHLDYVFDDEVKDDSLTLATIQKWKFKLKDITDQKISYTPSPLTRSYGEESLLGNLTSDAIKEAYPEIDLAVTNSGALRQDIPAGDITLGSLISAFPFPNTVVICEVTGAQLLQLLDHAASLTNGILQVSAGVNFTYIPTQESGKRVIDITLHGKKIESNKRYKVATSNFVADGGDGYGIFKQSINIQRTPDEIVQVMARYLSKRPVYKSALEGRLTLVR